jgi:trans-aconitate methyltransferase
MKPSQALAKYGSDKVYVTPNGSHHYGDFYDELFSKLKHPLNILEIGVLKGQSLMAWRDAFPDAKVTGIDIVKYDSLIELEDVTFIQSDIKKIKLTEKYDIILDDSSHDLKESLYEIEHFCENLTEQGVMIIEDIQIPELYIKSMLKVLPKGFILDSHDFRHLSGYAKHDDFIVKITRE